MKRFAVMALCLFGLYACMVQAAPFTFSVSYTEPTVNADGTVLDDLASTQTFYSTDGSPFVGAVPTPASSPTGGGSIVKTLIIDLTVGASHTVSVFARATDTSGNESADSNTDTTTQDFLAPGAPQGTMIRRV